MVGSPVKMENIGGKQKANMDDPRPLKYRAMPGYNSFVQNQVVNYCASANKDLAFRYVMPVADLQTAVDDDDYLQLSFTEYWIDNANKVKEY